MLYSTRALGRYEPASLALPVSWKLKIADGESLAMKLYSAAPKASITMIQDEKLSRLLAEMSSVIPITHVLETGTHVGLGSTRFIAEILSLQPVPPQRFVTIEANYRSWRRAVANLKKFPFVTPLWGLSTSRQEALRFIRDDPALQNHREYPDVFIDDVQDPVKFYSSEIAGRLGGNSRNPLETIRQFVDRRRFYAGEDLLAKWLEAFRSHRPLIVLDSAGGVGYLEFKIVQRQMIAHPHFLLLDDICHLKHFRSVEHVHGNGQFEILGENKEVGWLLAKYEPVRQ